MDKETLKKWLKAGFGDRKKAGEILEEPSYQEDRNGFT
jgi:hypothetical protein